MNLAKKLAKIFSLIFLASFLASCDKGCVAADEFDGKSVTVESNPGADKIIGTYNGDYDYVNNDVTGGQKVEWTQTGLRSNGEQFLIQVTGQWTPWFGEDTNPSQLDELPSCNFCTKKNGVANCICHRTQVSVPEIGTDGYTKVEANCSGADQNNPAKCTCTTNYGPATAYSAYHTPLNYQDKYGKVKSANEQEPCKYNGGMGLYLGLFGRSGNVTPVRIYHLFTEEAVCDIGLDGNGKCLDENGKDVTKYLFRSANKTIFVKDDKQGKGNSSDDDYFGRGAIIHAPNEEVKMIIYDSYYLDNTGSYNATFFNGVGSSKGTGLLEFLVSLIEDTVMGEESCVSNPDADKKNCVREGGVIEFMYKAIVMDSDFIKALHVILALYISFYGIATLIGVAEINKKELTSRIIKIGLIILFTTASSWTLYNEIIVKFFVDSMNYVIGMFMDLSDSNLDSQTSSILISQIDRATDNSNSTRFSFIDLTITKLLSAAAAKKIFSLFFNSLFGLLYIFVIYFLIAAFIYVMLLAATFYVVNLMKMVVVLSLGPVFMCFSLFSQTNPIFKRWISYLGSRSLEIVIMFIILYNFVVLIDQKFVALLYYKTCYELWGLPSLKIGIYKAYIDRSLVSWCTDFIALGGLIFITKLIIDKIPSVAGYLITIGGDANKDVDNIVRGQSSMNLAGRIMGGGKDPSGGSERGVLGFANFAAEKGFGAAKFSAGAVVQGGTQVLRATGASALIDKILAPLPNSPRSMYRNKIIDTAIDQAKKDATAKGLTGVKADLFVRQQTISAMQTKMYRGENPPNKAKAFDPSGMKLAGVNMTSVLARLDDKLVKEPLKAFIKEEAAKQKSAASSLTGDALKKELRDKTNEWAEKNLSGGKKAIEKHLGKMEDLIKKQSRMTTSESAKSFAGDKEGQNKYLQHLKDNEFKNQQKMEARKGKLGETAYRIGSFVSSVVNRNDSNNPTKQREIFLRKVEKNERKAEAVKVEGERIAKNAAEGKSNILRYFDPRNVSLGDIRDRATGDLVFGRWFERDKVNKFNKETDDRVLRDTLSDSDKRFKQDQDATNKRYDKKIGELLGTEAAAKSKIEQNNKEYEEKVKGGALNKQREKDLKKEKEGKNALCEEMIKKSSKDREDLGVEREKSLKEIDDKMKLFESQKEAFFKEQVRQNSLKDIEDKFKEIEALRNGKNEEDKLKAEKMQQELLQKANSDYERVKEEQAKARQSIIEAGNDKERADRLRELGGEGAITKGLNGINIDGRKTSLLEESSRLQYVNERIEKDVKDRFEASRNSESSVKQLRDSGSIFGKKHAEKRYVSERVNKFQKDVENIRKEQIAREYQESYDRRRGAEIESERTARTAEKAQREAKFAEEKISKLQKEAQENAEKIAALEKAAKEFQTIAVIGSTPQEQERQFAKLKAQEEANNRSLVNAQRKAESLKKDIALAQKKSTQIKKIQNLEKDIGKLNEEILKSERELSVVRSELISATNQRKMDLEQQQKDAEERSIASQKALYQLRKTAELGDSIHLFREAKLNSEREVSDLSSDPAYLEHQRNIKDAKKEFFDQYELFSNSGDKRDSIVLSNDASNLSDANLEMHVSVKNLKKTIEDNEKNGVQTSESTIEAYNKALEISNSATNLRNNIKELRKAQKALKFVQISNKKLFADSEEDLENLSEPQKEEEERVERALIKAEKDVEESKQEFAKLREEYIKNKLADIQEGLKRTQEEAAINAARITENEERLKSFAMAAVIGNTPEERNAHSLELAKQEADIKKEISDAKFVAEELRRKEELAKAEIAYIETREDLKRQNSIKSFGNKDLEVRLAGLQDEERNALSNVADLEKKFKEVRDSVVGDGQEERDAHLAQKANAEENLKAARVIAELSQINAKLAETRIGYIKLMKTATDEIYEAFTNLQNSKTGLDVARSNSDYVNRKQEVQEARNRAEEARDAITEAEKEQKRLQEGVDIKEAREGLKRMDLEDKIFAKSIEKISLNEAAFDLDSAIAATISLQEELTSRNKKALELQADINQIQGKISEIEDDADSVAIKSKLVREVLESQIEIRKINDERLTIQVEIDEAKKLEFIKGMHYNICRSEEGCDKAREEYVKFQNYSNGKYETPEAISERERLLHNIYQADQRLKYDQYEFLKTQVDASGHANLEIDEAEKFATDPESWDNIRNKTEEISRVLDEIDEKKSLSDYLKAASENAQAESESKGVEFKVYSLSSDKVQANARARLAKLDKNVRESELLSLKSKDENSLTSAEKIRISVLEQEVDKFEQDAKKYESEAEKIESQISSLSSS